MGNFLREKKWKNWDKSQWSIVILTGILLMILALPTESTKTEKTETPEKKNGQSKLSETKEDYAEKMQTQLESVLSEIAGAGRVEVMITLKDNGESIVEKDISKEQEKLSETASVNENRTEVREETGEETVYTENGNEKEPFVENKMTPKIAGVLVVAEGGGNTFVKQEISEAVMALFQIDVNRIKVVKMNMQEERAN